LISDAQQHTQKFIGFDPRSRNAHIALLDIVLTGLKRGERTEDDLVSACQNYFNQHKSKLYAFQDLRGILETRDASVVRRVSQYCMDSIQDKPVRENLLVSMYAS